MNVSLIPDENPLLIDINEIESNLLKTKIEEKKNLDKYSTTTTTTIQRISSSSGDNK